MTTPRAPALHPNCAPRLLRRPAAAEYLGISLSKLDDWVKSRIIPKPTKLGGCVVYDRKAIDRAIDQQSERDDDGGNPFD